MEDYPRTLTELERRFATDQACRQYLFALRWPEGFVCPRCQSTGNVWPTARGLWLCGSCRHQASVTAGTIFQDGKLFYRLIQQAVQVEPAPYRNLVHPQAVGGG